MQLAACCPGLTLRSGWSTHTRDGVIPWKLFWLFYRQVPRIAAGRRLSDMEALVNARAISYADRKKPGDMAAMKRLVDDLRALADGTE